MLQYFPKRSYRPTFQKGSSPALAYICNVGPEASHMPRSLHEHPHLAEILLVYSGAGIYMIDGRRYTAQKGDLILYNSHVVHDEHGGSGSELGTYCAAIRGLVIDGLLPDHILAPALSPVQPTGDDFDAFFALFTAIEKEAPRHPETAHYLTLALVTKTAALLADRGQAEAAAVPTLVKEARAYIDRNYKENICLVDIAAATHTNPYYLAHEIRGAAPHGRGAEPAHQHGYEHHADRRAGRLQQLQLFPVRLQACNGHDAARIPRAMGALTAA